MEIEEFAILAKEKFGGKIIFSGISINQKDLDAYNSQSGNNLDIDTLKSYKQLWLIENKCPVCEADLLGFFGSFNWGIVHGEGYCSNCNKASFQYYHYIGNSTIPLKLFSLVGFNEN